MKTEIIRYAIISVIIILLTLPGSSVAMDAMGKVYEDAEGSASFDDGSFFAGSIQAETGGADIIKDAEELDKAYKDFLTQNPDAKAVETMTASPEISYLVYRLYRCALNREPDIEGFRFWCDTLAKKGEASGIIGSFVFGEEGSAICRDNEDFVNMLFLTLFGRDPSEKEADEWAEQLNYTCTREHMQNSLVSGEGFSEFCNKSGVTVGAAIEEPDTTDEWKLNIEVLNICNDEREKEGFPKLATREDLWRKAAQTRVNELPIEYSHQRPDGTACWTVYENTGLIPYNYAAENIALGYSGAKAVTRGWLASDSHRENIMHPNEGYMATAYLKKFQRKPSYYCQIIYSSASD